MLGRELSSGTQAIAPPPHQQEFKHFYELPMMKNCEIPQRTSKCPYSAEKKKEEGLRLSEFRDPPLQLHGPFAHVHSDCHTLKGSCFHPL